MTITFTKGELTMIASTGIVRPGDASDLAKFALALMETRTVTLPQRQEPTSSGHYGEGYLVPSNAGSALDYEDTVEALAEAGISIKGE
ncbi:hypothetical protein M8013_14455 [Enterobacteriaceae bacterium H4N4]|uniref:Uncharacterized protein n=1 Tax=Silvania confinis TaxID=2926470 RepID=A0A9J6QGC1_9ENTR|nr:hypothetical protein [Silvania confinis]MCU6669945.1 hypothetical protein [Silvania confinis]